MSMKKDRAAHEIPIAYPDEQRALFLSPKGNLSIYPYVASKRHSG